MIASTLVVIVLALVAESAPEKESTKTPQKPPPKATAGRDAAIARVRSVLPQDWTIERTGLPTGVEAIAFGPATQEGRPVLIATRLPDPTAPFDRPSLEATLGAKIISFEPAGLLGATEVRTEASFDGQEFIVMHVLGAPVAPYAISLVVPKPMFLKVYKTLLVAAERLAASDRALSEKVGTRR